MAPVAPNLDEERFRQLLDAAPDAIFEVDPRGGIVFLNGAAERCFGYSRAELLGQPVEILVPEAARAAHTAQRAGYQREPAVRPMGMGLELRAQRKDGSSFPVEISLSPVQYADRRHVTAIVRDVSDRRRLQETHAAELAATNAALELRNQEIERANRLKSEFLASMSHELRTPLHTIIGFSELLGEGLDGELNATQRRFVEHIHRDSLHLLELINDILDLSKIEAGRLELTCAPVPLEGALQEVLATIRPQAAAKSQRLRVDAPGEMTLEADRVRFKEILYNLLSNAVKFTPEGGSIRISLAPAGEFAAISVEDTGIGIAPESQSIVFDAFRQVGSTTKGIREGTGLGLSITRSLVEQHGGRLSLTSEPGRGSCFRFTIPLIQEQRASRPRPLLLIVQEQRPASGALALAGYDFAFASQLRDAASLAQRLSPDAVLLGPGMAKAEQRLREQGFAGRILEIPASPNAAALLTMLAGES
ncbi:MAG: PAS domain S-box protein [Bryobacteraceae bacterium]|nr:PAS domain S-box protein [Bryobacteraceae bacterium]